MVYFLWDRRREILKIGGTCRLRVRLWEQGVGEDDRLILLGVMEGEWNSEHCIREYARCLARQIGYSDWLEPSRELAEFVNRHVLPALMFDYGRDASEDDAPYSAVLYHLLFPRCFVPWLERVARRAGTRMECVIEEAIKAFALAAGVTEAPPDFPRPRRRKPLIKVDRQGRWWILRPEGGYAPGFFEDRKDDDGPGG